MAIYVRPFVTSIAHVEGCPKRNCGPSCARQTDGWEYHIKLVLPNGDRFEERKKSPVNGKANTQRYAEERAAHAIRASVAPAVAAKKGGPDGLRVQGELHDLLADQQQAEHRLRKGVDA